MVTDAALNMLITKAAMELHYARIYLRSASRTKDLANQELSAINLPLVFSLSLRRKYWGDGCGKEKGPGGGGKEEGSGIKKASPAGPDPAAAAPAGPWVSKAAEKKLAD